MLNPTDAIPGLTAGSLSTSTAMKIGFAASLVLSPQAPAVRRAIPGQAGDDVSIWRSANQTPHSGESRNPLLTTTRGEARLSTP